MSATKAARFLGRYAMHDELASGGMATIHLGRLLGPVGFARTVAIKRLHPHYAKDPGFVAMFLDEARLAARIRHPNVVATVDVVALDGELFLVMDYVHGESLSRLFAGVLERGERVPPAVAAGIMAGALQGLHAAHEARSERGTPLEIVHRDVSPQNILVGTDGVTRVVDFGVAKAAGRLQTTEDGRPKGKAAYMAPEQIRGEAVDRRADIWAASVVLWELLANRRLFAGGSVEALMHAVLSRHPDPPSAFGGPPELDAIVMRGLANAPGERFETAREMAEALEAAQPSASARAIGEWVEASAGDTLHERALRVEEMESAGGSRRSSEGSLRRQLVGLGFDPAPSARAAPPPSSEEPTGAAPGRHLASDAPPAPSTRPPASSDGARAEEREVRVSDVVPKAAAPPPSTRPAAAKDRRGAYLVVLAGVVAGGVALGAWALRGQPTSGSDARPSSSPEVSAAPPFASGASGAASAEASPTASSTAAQAPSAGATSSASASAPPARPLARTATPPGRPSASARPPSCDPPYTVGPAPDFIRRPKLECIGQ